MTRLALGMTLNQHVAPSLRGDTGASVLFLAQFAILAYQGVVVQMTR